MTKNLATIAWLDEVNAAQADLDRALVHGVWSAVERANSRLTILRNAINRYLEDQP